MDVSPALLPGRALLSLLCAHTRCLPWSHSIVSMYSCNPLRGEVLALFKYERASCSNTSLTQFPEMLPYHPLGVSVCPPVVMLHLFCSFLFICHCWTLEVMTAL